MGGGGVVGVVVVGSVGGGVVGVVVGVVVGSVDGGVVCRDGGVGSCWGGGGGYKLGVLVEVVVGVVVGSVGGDVVWRDGGGVVVGEDVICRDWVGGEGSC